VHNVKQEVLKTTTAVPAPVDLAQDETETPDFSQAEQDPRKDAIATPDQREQLRQQHDRTARPPPRSGDPEKAAPLIVRPGIAKRMLATQSFGI
jgi:hypothetical protein